MSEEQSPPMIVLSNVRELTNGEFVGNGMVEIKQELIEPELDAIEPTPVEAMEAGTESGETLAVELNNTCNCTVEELLDKPYMAREFSRTLEIIQKGRPTPNLSVNAVLNRNPTKRLLKEHYYEKVEWLTGCAFLSKLYCWPCLLFDRVPGIWNRTGFEDVYNFHKAYKRHENTQNHIVASMQLVAFVMNHCEDRVREDADERNALIMSNRETFKRIVVAIACTGGACPSGLGTKQLLRLARRESSPLSIIPELHLAVLNATNLSFNATLADQLQDSPFVSLFLDETSEGQVATVLRYTSSKGELEDTFAGFMDGDDLGTIIARTHVQYKLQGKLVAILLGALTRLDTLPKETKMVMLHSPAHRMSQVIPHALRHLKECSAFFHIIHCFEVWLKDSYVEEVIKTRIPNSNVPKFRERSVTALHEHREIMQDLVLYFLEKPTSCNSLAYKSALALQHALKDTEFLFMLRVFKELLPVTDALLDMVMSNSPNIKVCSETVEDYLKVLKWKKEKFDVIWESVQEVDLDGPASKKPRHVGTSRLVAYYRTLYESIVDAVVAQVEMRFGCIKSLEFAEFLDMKDCERTAVSEKLMMLLRAKRDDFESSRLRSELLVSYAQVDFRRLQCDHLLRHLYDTGLSGPLRQVTRLARLILVMPYASKTSTDACLKLFTKIHNFSKQANLDPDMLPWASVTLENKLLNRFTLSDSFFESVMQNFNITHPQIELTPFKPKTL